ncbi:thiol:disulfide interchange protein DsbG, partial [Salmonella enterica]|nr:thiol:disulfide interchange protein DsbG [Salmonella enterica]
MSVIGIIINTLFALILKGKNMIKRTLLLAMLPILAHA